MGEARRHARLQLGGKLPQNVGSTPLSARSTQCRSAWVPLNEAFLGSLGLFCTLASAYFCLFLSLAKGQPSLKVTPKLVFLPAEVAKSTQKGHWGDAIGGWPAVRAGDATGSQKYPPWVPWLPMKPFHPHLAIYGARPKIGGCG